MHYQLKNTINHEILPGYRGQFVHSQNMTFVYWDIDPDMPLPEHAHPHEQVMHVLEGTFELTVSGKKHVLHAGDIFVIAGSAIHSGRSVTACKILDVFYPVRRDYKVI